MPAIRKQQSKSDKKQATNIYRPYRYQNPQAQEVSVHAGNIKAARNSYGGTNDENVPPFQPPHPLNAQPIPWEFDGHLPLNNVDGWLSWLAVTSAPRTCVGPSYTPDTTPLSHQELNLLPSGPAAFSDGLSWNGNLEGASSNWDLPQALAAASPLPQLDDDSPALGQTSTNLDKLTPEASTVHDQWEWIYEQPGTAYGYAPSVEESSTSAGVVPLPTSEKSPSGEPQKPSNPIVQCSWAGCGKPMKRSNLTRHVNTVHLKFGTQNCPTCHKPFSRGDSLRRHLPKCRG